LPSLLANILNRSKKCHEWFRLGMGEWTESSDESSTENEVPTLKPLKKLKLSVPKDKENRWQLVDDATEAAFSKQFVPRNTTTSTKWAVSNFVAWRDGQNARDQIHDALLVEQLVLFVQNGTIKRAASYTCSNWC